MFIAAGVVGVLVAGDARLRDRHGHPAAASDDADEPVQIHGNIRLEIGWTIVPFAHPRRRRRSHGHHALRPRRPTPEDAHEINVYGQQWWWSYEYDLDGDGDARDRHRQRARDPGRRRRSSSSIAVARRDPLLLDPGAGRHPRRRARPRPARSMLEADEPGVYDGQCKEFCGLSHANMRARAVALSPADFDDVARAAAAGRRRRPTERRRGRRRARGCSRPSARRCHQIDGVERRSRARRAARRRARPEPHPPHEPRACSPARCSTSTYRRETAARVQPQPSSRRGCATRRA